MIPDKNRLLILIVFGGKEREKVETILNELSPNICNEYTSATTYHDGKWLAIAVDSDETRADIKKLLLLSQRKSRNIKTTNTKCEIISQARTYKYY